MIDTQDAAGPSKAPKKRRGLRRWFKSTSNRTFAVYPVLVIGVALAAHGGSLPFVPWGLPLLLWGYLQYRLCGNYRTRVGGGGPGLEVPPDRIVDEGIYGYIRNPMYLGHLIFMAGLAITFRSWLAVALLVFHCVWFDLRVRSDEVHLEARFGDAYRAYKARVKRWIPGVY
jgi:hypothetical protein